MKLIEYIGITFKKNKTMLANIKDVPLKSGDIVLNKVFIDIADISCINEIGEFFSALSTKQNNKIIILGKHRELCNRWVYTIYKKPPIFEDNIIRPSQYTLYNLSKFSWDNVHMDEYQCAGFIYCYNKIEQLNIVESITQEKIKLALNHLGLI